MKYFSEAYFRNIAYSTPLYEQRTYSDNLQGASLYKQFDIFLSYNISMQNVKLNHYIAVFERVVLLCKICEQQTSNRIESLAIESGCIRE